MRIFSHPNCIRHTVPDGHPERPDRLQALLTHFEASGLSQDYPLIEASPADTEAVLRAHPHTQLSYLQSMQPHSGVVPMDPDTWMGAESLNAALLAAGAVCTGVENVIQGVDRRVFCAVRPPGHHAESDAAMGFCLLNSIAIGALHALTHPGINRVAILDFDVHHGNGTVEICKEHPDILVCSSFQHPYYPHRFYENDWPNVVNTPLKAGTTSTEFRQAIERDWLPAVERVKPDLILVSAGFDAHALDPLAGLLLDESDFEWVTSLITSLANDYAQGRVVSALEGGYDLEALKSSVTAHLTALA